MPTSERARRALCWPLLSRTLAWAQARSPLGARSPTQYHKAWQAAMTG